MKIVTLCGSMRFKNEMKKIGYILETKYDMCVLQCVYNEDGMELGEKENRGFGCGLCCESSGVYR